MGASPFELPTVASGNASLDLRCVRRGMLHSPCGGWNSLRVFCDKGSFMPHA